MCSWLLMLMPSLQKTAAKAAATKATKAKAAPKAKAAAKPRAKKVCSVRHLIHDGCLIVCYRRLHDGLSFSVFVVV